jgi:hypothetical protein
MKYRSRSCRTHLGSLDGPDGVDRVPSVRSVVDQWADESDVLPDGWNWECGLVLWKQLYDKKSIMVICVPSVEQPCIVGIHANINPPVSIVQENNGFDYPTPQFAI